MIACLVHLTCTCLWGCSSRPFAGLSVVLSLPTIFIQFNETLHISNPRKDSSVHFSHINWLLSTDHYFKKKKRIAIVIFFSFSQKSLMWVISFVTAATAKNGKAQASRNSRKGFSPVLNVSFSCFKKKK